MNIQVTQENLNRALSNVAKVATGRNSLPILSNILIKTIDNRVAISATNLNIAITHYIGSKVQKTGSLTIPARLTQDFVASLPSGVIELTQEETKLHIKAEKYESTINGSPAEDYPVMPTIKGGTKWKVPAQEFKKAISQVVGSASTDEARPILTGVYLYTSNGSLFVAATDSYRLAEKKIIKIDKDVDLIIPASSLQDLLRVIPDSLDEISVTHDDQQVLFVAGDTELVTRLIEGKYPEYQKLIPSKFSSSTKAKKVDLVNITKVSSLFARESAGSINIQLDSAQNKISIKSIASQLGENTAEADAEVAGEGLITLNSRYLLDALGCIDETEVTIAFNGKLEPFVVKPSGKDGQTHIIMPLKS